MKTASLCLVLATAFLTSCEFGTMAGHSPQDPQTDSGKPEREALDGPSLTSGGEYTICGPYSYKNLSVFFIEGTDRTSGNELLPLQEAMEQSKVIVHETSNVNELFIENLSNEEVYVQAGDIVKGGKQDRVLGNDLVLGPNSGRVPIASFCVEQGRWHRRAGEPLAFFRASNNHLASKDLKLAARYTKDQSQVWQQVARLQSRLAGAVETASVSLAETSSLQLSLENESVQEAAGEYYQALLGAAKGKKDTMGFAFAINGDLNSADIDASGELFGKLYPKLLKACALEAVASTVEEQTQFSEPDVAAVRSWLSEAESGEASKRELSGRIQLLTRETENNVFFETRDRAQLGAWIHRSYVRK